MKLPPWRSRLVVDLALNLDVDQPQAQAILDYLAKRGALCAPKRMILTVRCHCGVSFETTRRDQKFCSVQCGTNRRVATFRAKKIKEPE